MGCLQGCHPFRGAGGKRDDDDEIRTWQTLQRSGRYTSATLATLRSLDPDKLNLDLALATLEWICTADTGRPGAVLVFLPGSGPPHTLHIYAIL